MTVFMKKKKHAQFVSKFSESIRKWKIVHNAEPITINHRAKDVHYFWENDFFSPISKNMGNEFGWKQQQMKLCKGKKMTGY